MNSLALAGMSDGQFNILGQRGTALGVLFRNHIKNVLKLALRFFRRAANRMATVNGRNIGHKTPVRVPMANHVIVKQRFHWRNLTRDGHSRKNIFSFMAPAFGVNYGFQTTCP